MEIAVQALSESLDPFISRTAIDEVIGLAPPARPLDARRPTRSCTTPSYAAHVGLLEDAVEFLPAAEANEAARGFLSYVRSLILIVPLAKTSSDFLRRAAAMPALREQCIETVVATLHYEGKALPEAVGKSELHAIRAELTESSFSDKLRRHQRA